MSISQCRNIPNVRGQRDHCYCNPGVTQSRPKRTEHSKHAHGSTDTEANARAAAEESGHDGTVATRPRGREKTGRVPSRAGRSEERERHGILDFFFATIVSSALLCNMGAADGRATPTADHRQLAAGAADVPLRR